MHARDSAREINQWKHENLDSIQSRKAFRAIIKAIKASAMMRHTDLMRGR
jgi:hypothetical protein